MECDKVRKEFPTIKFESCCEYCHKKDDNGYSYDLWFLAPDGKMKNVCCAIGRGLRNG